MEEAQEHMDCGNSEMIPSSPKEEASPDIPEIGMEEVIQKQVHYWQKVCPMMICWQ